METKKFNKGDKVHIDLRNLLTVNKPECKVKKDLFDGKEGVVLYTDKFGVAVKIEGGFSDSFPAENLTLVTEKKPKNGFDRLKVKYAKLKAEKEEVERRAKDSDETIRKQGTKISNLTADLANAQSEAREYRSKFEEAVRRMGWLRRWWYGYDRPQFTDEDHWHD